MSTARHLAVVAPQADQAPTLTAVAPPAQGSAAPATRALLPDHDTLVRIGKGAIRPPVVASWFWWQVAQSSGAGMARIADFTIAAKQAAVAEERRSEAMRQSRHVETLTDRSTKRAAMRAADKADTRARIAEVWAGLCLHTRIWPAMAISGAGGAYGVWEYCHASLATMIAAPPATVLAGGFVLGALGRIGNDAPALKRARIAHGFEPGRVLEAIASFSKALAEAVESGQVQIPWSAYDSEARCYRFEIETPASARKLVANRNAWATALNIQENRIALAEAPTISARTFILTVFESDPGERKRAPYPYVGVSTVDATGPVVIGDGMMGEPVTIEVPDSDVGVFGVKGSGKTERIKNLLVPRALDAREQLKIIDAKDTSDYAEFEPATTDFITGSGFEEIRAAVEMLEWVRDEHMPAVAQAMREAGVRKITSENAHLPGLGFLTIVIDECQALFDHPDFGRRGTEAVVWIQKMGRAYGIKFIFGTQVPSKRALPTEINRQITGARFCHRMEFQTEVALAIGSSAYEPGGAAQEIPTTAVGTAVLKGGGNGALVATRAYLLTPEILGPIIANALTARGGAVTKRLEALPPPDPEHPGGQGNVLDDILSLRPHAIKPGPGLWYRAIVDGLRSKYPDRYGEKFTLDFLKALMVTHGVEPKGINIGGKNNTGYRFDDIEAARKGLRP